MSDASCRLISVLFDMLDELGVPHEAILSGTELELAVLQDESNWICWDDLCAVVRNASALVGGPDELEARATRLLFNTAANKTLNRITRILASPRALYAAFPRWIIPQLFSMMEVEREDLGENRVRFHFRYADCYQELPEHVRLIKATLVGLPTLLGLPRATVLLACQGREAVYDVYHPASRTLFSRLVRVWQALFAPDSLTRELEVQAANLAERYQELARAREREARSSQAKSRFLALISHELRTPLNGILGTVQLMEDTELSPQQCELVDSNRESAAYLLELITSILDFTSLYAGDIEVQRGYFSLRQLMLDCQTAWGEAAAARNNALLVSFPELEEPLVGDKRRLAQALDRLLSNAVRFTRDGEIRLAASQVEGGWRFEVSDTGIGMSPELAQQAWEPLVRGDDSITREHNGLGLGLPLVRNAVWHMGGEVGWRSVEGEGTSIWLTLPLRDASEERITEELELDEPEPTEASAGPVRILIVEDHPVNQLVMRKMVTSLGFDVDVASDGREGVERYAAGRYGAVLMDCQMPVMDGHTATRHIRRYESDEPRHRVPIIAVTAHALDSDRRKALDAGMDRYLTKPIDREELQRTLRELLVA